jgi:AraC-like DNA-binding protein
VGLDDPYEQVTWLRPKALDGWEYLIVRRSRHLWTIFHETYTLCAQPGMSTWYYRGRLTVANAPGTMLLEPGETHRTLAIAPLPFKVVLIPRAVVAQAALDLGLPESPHLVGTYTQDPRLYQAIWRLGEMVEQETSERLELQTLQHSVLSLMLEHSEHALPPTDGLDGRVSRAAEYLHFHFTQSVSLDELAAAAGLSRFVLVRSFSRRYGVPPHAFQLNLRITRARELLAKGIPAGLVAAELGFCDQSHFARHFKRIVRVNPGEYARQTGIAPSARVEKRCPA